MPNTERHEPIWRTVRTVSGSVCAERCAVPAARQDGHEVTLVQGDGGKMQPVYTVTLNPGLDRTLTVFRRFDTTRCCAPRNRGWTGAARASTCRGPCRRWAWQVSAMGFVGGAVGGMLGERAAANWALRPTSCDCRARRARTQWWPRRAADRYVKVNEAGPMVTRRRWKRCTNGCAGWRRREGGLWALCGSLPPGVPVNVYARLIAVGAEGRRTRLPGCERGCAARGL